MEKECRPLACCAEPKSWHILQLKNGRYIQYRWEGDFWAQFNSVQELTKAGVKYICPYLHPDTFSISQTLLINERISHLHEANNREVEAHRATKAQLRQLQAVLNRLLGLET